MVKGERKEKSSELTCCTCGGSLVFGGSSGGAGLSSGESILTCCCMIGFLFVSDSLLLLFECAEPVAVEKKSRVVERGRDAGVVNGLTENYFEFSDHFMIENLTLLPN